MTYKVVHDTLDDALKHILSDIYGHDTVEREFDYAGEHVGYVTFNGSIPSGDPVLWTHEDGLEDPGGDDHTPLMEPHEVICDPAHLRHHFDQVEEFENGEYSALGFVFAEVHAYLDEDTNEGADDPCVGYIYELHIYRGTEA